ncbi:MAG: hypothetical protein H7Z19_09390 [Chitinophagaceae bacterium]|nr:hypothetical protein [Rubrivivax sp.]
MAAVLGVLWNAYGVYQFAGSFTQTLDSLMATGMTQAQAQVYLALPAWIGVVFAVGVSGGLIGSLAMAARRSVAVPIFATSLVAYVMLFAGDAYHGVFASIPSQLAILAVVVLIAAALLGAARLAQRRGLLR